MQNPAGIDSGNPDPVPPLLYMHIAHNTMSTELPLTRVYETSY